MDKFLLTLMVVTFENTKRIRLDPYLMWRTTRIVL
jgi:hypothetical protein